MCAARSGSETMGSRFGHCGPVYGRLVRGGPVRSGGVLPAAAAGERALRSRSGWPRYRG